MLAIEEAALEREKARMVAAIRESDTKPETLLSRSFSTLIYGNHPYGLRASGEAATVAALTRDPSLQMASSCVALTERDGGLLPQLPDRIFLFRGPLLDMCADVEELTEEIRITVVHEVAHHFGIDDDRLHELGWG